MKLKSLGVDIKANDVAVILRPLPDLDADGEWSGNYQVLLAGFGPITMSEKDMEYMISAALLIASAASFIEINKEFGNALVEHCQNTLSEHRDVLPTPTNFTFSKQDSFDFDEDTKTHGGMQ